MYYKNFYPRKLSHIKIKEYNQLNKQTEDFTVNETDSIITLSTARKKKKEVQFIHKI